MFYADISGSDSFGLSLSPHQPAAWGQLIQRRNIVPEEIPLTEIASPCVIFYCKTLVSMRQIDFKPQTFETELFKNCVL